MSLINCSSTCDIFENKGVLLSIAELMKNLDHPHIVRLIGVIEVDPVWIVMELYQHGEVWAFMCLYVCV